MALLCITLFHLSAEFGFKRLDTTEEHVMDLVSVKTLEGTLCRQMKRFYESNVD